MYIPHFSINGSAFYCFAQKPDFNRICGYDVAIVQRCCTNEQFEFVRLCRMLGIKVIYDADDDVWDLPDYNPAQALFSRLKEGFNTCIQMVDVMTVSTKTLKKVVQKRVKTLKNFQTGKEIPIIVCENKIDKRIFISPQRKSEFIVGWAGSSSHIGDLELVTGAINALAPLHTDKIFEFRGCDPPASLNPHPNFRHMYWTPVAEYQVRMPLWGWSIALAPVSDHPFNNSKSPLKMVEAGYCGIPCLASYMDPYYEFCSHDPELKWLLCAGKMNWEPKLRDLLNDDARREELGRRMRSVVDNHYSFDIAHEGWLEAIKTAVNI